MILNLIWNSLLTLFFPNLCPGCHRLIGNKDFLCPFCLSSLPYAPYFLSSNNPVEQRFLGKININYATAYLTYDKGGITQHIIHSLKYHDNKRLATQMGIMIAEDLQEAHSPLCDVDVLIPVPLHPRKKRQRGYNQSECIAQGISSIWNTPIDTTSIYRTIYTKTQTHKNIQERWINVQNIFHSNHPEHLKNKHVLIIDDVITTGATLCACAQAISDIPGIRISILALSFV